MAFDHHPSLLLRTGDKAEFLGVSNAGSARMRGEVWVVHHAGDDWTHLYRVDGQRARTVHLVLCEAGDRRHALREWALARLDLAPAPSLRMAA